MPRLYVLLNMTKDNKTKDPRYTCYRAMLARCYNENNPDYYNYGARGITVCDRWLKSFWNFAEDMGERPEGFTIERKTSNSNYGPDTCRWATRLDQTHNRRWFPRECTSPTPYIHITPTKSYCLQMSMGPKDRFYKTFKTLTEAENLRTILLFERDINEKYGLV